MRRMLLSSLEGQVLLRYFFEKILPVSSIMCGIYPVRCNQICTRECVLYAFPSMPYTCPHMSYQHIPFCSDIWEVESECVPYILVRIHTYTHVNMHMHMKAQRAQSTYAPVYSDTEACICKLLQESNAFIRISPPQ